MGQRSIGRTRRRRQRREDALAKQRIKDEIAKDKAEREARLRQAYVRWPEFDPSI
jgi:hypothetical protein